MTTLRYEFLYNMIHTSARHHMRTSLPCATLVQRLCLQQLVVSASTLTRHTHAARRHISTSAQRRQQHTAASTTATDDITPSIVASSDTAASSHITTTETQPFTLTHSRSTPQVVKPHSSVWHLFDANGQTVGRLAVAVARLLQGKHKASYQPHLDDGDYVVIINSKYVKFTGSKWDKKLYRWHTGYPGGLKEVTAKEMHVCVE